MSELLVNHAKRTIWQVPRQDHQFNIGLARLTRTGGFIGSTKVLWHRVLNPTRNDSKRYYHHVYQIGQISPLTLNLANKLDTDFWVPAKQLINEYNIFIEVYFESGAVVPIDFVWLMKDHKNNLVLAVKIVPRFDYGEIRHIDEFSDITETVKITTDNDRLITRFYTNALGSNTNFNQGSTVKHDTVETLSKSIDTLADWTEFKHSCLAIKQKFNNRGGALWYKDGFLVNEPKSYHSDMLSHRYTFVWDESFKFRQIFPLEGLASFKSKIDRGYNKYLLVTDSIYDEIDFFDDLDFYLIVGDSENYTGVYINRSKDRFIRQVSHNAYAIDASLINKYLTSNLLFLNSNKPCHILVQARSGGAVKPTYSQVNRLDELYRLPYDKVLAAFYNVNALVPEWQASNLEDSSYVKLMSNDAHKLTPALITDAYGYTGIVSQLAYPKCVVNKGVVHLPDSLCVADERTGLGRRSVFVYNNQGLLLGTVYSTALSKTLDVSTFTDAGITECFRLTLKSKIDKLSIYHNQDVEDSRLEDCGFACYVSAEENGRASEKWIDVTDGVFYKYHNGKITWYWELLTQSNLYPCVKINDEVLVVQVTPQRKNELKPLKVTLTGLQDYAGYSLVKPIYIPYATVDVFVNGEYMIEGVDYILGDNYPHIIVTNAWANNLTNPNVVIRAYGLGNPKTSKPYPPQEVGFIKDGYVSANAQYDVSKYRPNNLVVNSRVVEQHRYKYSEYDEGVKYPVDGRPYMLRDYILPVEHIATGSSTELYQEMVDIDARVSAYLNEYILPTPVVSPSINVERWSLISPVCSTILSDFMKGYMSDDQLPPDFNITDVNSYFESYRGLLKYDPCLYVNQQEYVYVRPHALTTRVNVTITQWRFLSMINSFYLNDVIDFTSFVTIGSN